MHDAGKVSLNETSGAFSAITNNKIPVWYAPELKKDDGNYPSYAVIVKFSDVFDISVFQRNLTVFIIYLVQFPILLLFYTRFLRSLKQNYQNN